MLDRVAKGELPAKHHIALRDPAGTLRHEECLTRMGFDGPYTILYHQHRPHLARVAGTTHGWPAPEAAPEAPLSRRHFQSQQMHVPGAPIDARRPVVFNDDVVVAVGHPDAPDPVYWNNADADELIYVFEGTGTLRTPFGELRYGPDDYIAVPRGVIRRFIPDPGVRQYWLTTECLGSLGLLKQWRNDVGQLRMDAPYCHRDFRRPTFDGPTDDGVRELVIKQGGRFHGFRSDVPFTDVVGWDGTVYPWIFPMLAFQPRAGLVHLPPDWHGTFGTRGAVICSFVPRVVDFHPDAIPCPYPHASVDCDEILFYCRGNFTSREGVGPGSISFHPRGIPHGPHPGSYEGSIGDARTNEQAVMIDTFAPLIPTVHAARVEDHGYHDSFIG